MKIKLLDDGGYPGLDNVIFPRVVNATRSKVTQGFEVHASELLAAGGCAAWKELAASNEHVYFHNFEVEVVE